MTKYRNKTLTYKGLYFPSILECNTYKVLESTNIIREIQCQYPIKLTPSITWVVDFKVLTRSNVVFIESKGMVTQTFKLKYQLLVDFHPNVISNLVLVVGSDRALKKVRKLHSQTVTLTELDNFLQIMEIKQ
jgi:hypothetical protein